MRPSLLFVTPVHGRLQLARICLRQLRRTCDALAENGIDASAVIVGDDANLETARELGFGTVRRDNEFLSRKFNDGIQVACDPAFNRRPADFVVPFGSDDWVDYRILLDLPGAGEVRVFRQAAFVNEDGSQIVAKLVDYTGGVGIRVYPRAIMAEVGYRPADEDRKRACDTSILTNIVRARRSTPRLVYGDRHPWQIVDWKSPGEQLNSYQQITARFRRGDPPADPFVTLADTFPAEALADMQAHYQEARTGSLVAA